MTPPEPIGLIAGNGSFPLLFAAAAARRQTPVVAVGLAGETEPALAGLVQSMRWVRVGQLGRIISTFRRAGVRRAAMAGGVRKARLFGGVRPDWRAWRVLARLGRRPDDGVLRAVAAEFERDGIEIVDSTLYMPEALAPEGVLTRRRPRPAQTRDLAYGLSLARAVGRLDVGQTVVVRDGAAVAIEAIEGTDACIERAGALTGRRGAVVVKVAKPGQDMRFDVPTVGPGTLAALGRAGAAVLGIEAGRTLILEPEAWVAAADRAGLVVVGLPPAAAAPP